MFAAYLSALFWLTFRVVTLGSLTCLFGLTLFLRLHRRFHTLSKQGIVIAFFHPYSFDGGGGERVLWTAIKTLQNDVKNVKLNIIIYTGPDRNGEILVGTKQYECISKQFGLDIQPVICVPLKTRKLLDASQYPRFTLLLQSLAGIVVGLEAFLQIVPDIYVDTMGQPFSYFPAKLAGSKVVAYVHYPTISTDMLDLVKTKKSTYNNRSDIAGSPLKSLAKTLYYLAFAHLGYRVCGKLCDVVMVNSSWTKKHIDYLWSRASTLVYPPCDVSRLLDLPLQSKKRERIVLSVAQFRPEKDHRKQILALHTLLERIGRDGPNTPRLVLVGSVRSDQDRARVDDLKRYCQELHMTEFVQFKENLPFDELVQVMSTAAVGIHTMWNEHFGIGIVELMAAGVVVVAHNSGGPAADIVDVSAESRSGYLAEQPDEYADALGEIFKSLGTAKYEQMQENGRTRSTRFSEEAFSREFLKAMTPILNTTN